MSSTFYNNNKLVVYNVKHMNVFDIIKYFNDFRIANIAIIKFIKLKSQDIGNIHLTIDKWYENNISKSFYNNLLDFTRSTKMVYNDPEYFEIEFDNFEHEYCLCENANYDYIIYNLNKSNNLSCYLNSLQNDNNDNNNENNDNDDNNNDNNNETKNIPQEENILKEDNSIVQQNEIQNHNNDIDLNSDCSSFTDLDNLVKYEEFYELSSEISTKIDNLTKMLKFQNTTIKKLKRKLDCSIDRINCLENNLFNLNTKQAWSTRLRNRHNRFHY